MVSDADRDDLRNGLRILARMIVRAHLRQAAAGRPKEEEAERPCQRRCPQPNVANSKKASEYWRA